MYGLLKYLTGMSSGCKVISCQKFTTLDRMLTTIKNYKVLCSTFQCLVHTTVVLLFYIFLINSFYTFVKNNLKLRTCVDTVFLKRQNLRF